MLRHSGTGWLTILATVWACWVAGPVHAGADTPGGAPAQTTQPTTQPVTVADFEDGAGGFRATHVLAGLDATNPAAGKASLKITPGRRAGHVIVPLPAGTQAGWFSHLECQVRAKATKPVRLRFYALSDDNVVMFQRVWYARGDDTWRTRREPLDVWRWGNLRAGRWDQVTRLAVRIEMAAESVHLDEIRLIPGDRGEASAYPAGDWLRKQAFGDEDFRLARSGDLVVATGAVQHFKQADLLARLRMLGRTRDWLVRLFGEGALKPEPGQEAALLIFTDPVEYKAFFERLGKAWRVTIVPPASGGYTVQSIAASSWKWQYGTDRPVYLHEGVHALVGVYGGLLTGTDAHSWLHEGLANYLQLCVYPDSLDKCFYEGFFDTGQAGQRRRKPWKQLVSRRADMADYAQLASMVAYLAEQQPKLLPPIVKGLREGVELQAILKQAGTDLDSLEKAWVAWGQKRSAGTGRDGERKHVHFAPPAEFADPVKAPPASQPAGS